MMPDYAVFTQALTRFHRYSVQNAETVRIEDVRAKVRLALTLLRPGGALAIVLNRRDAPMSRIGIAFELEEGRHAEATTNRDLLACCHTPDFYRDLAGPGFGVGVQAIDTPLREVPSRAELIGLLRMCLLNPLSSAPCDTGKLDRFIADWLDANSPGLTYPALIQSHDDLVILHRLVDVFTSQVADD